MDKIYLDACLVIYLSGPRFRIGEYLLREPDYRQILYWADHLGMEPDAVVQRLARSRKELCFKNRKQICLELIDGAIYSLVWDIDQFGVIPSEWREGVSIKTLALIGRWLVTMPLDLSPVPGLTRLDCWGNQITELNLSPVLGLTELVCGENQLTELDLAPVPGLTTLNCNCNQLTELGLAPVPGLTDLECSSNKLTALNLAPVPDLTMLECGCNQLTELDLSQVPGLTGLWCGSNELTALNLAPVPGMTWLDCCDTQLTELDLSPVPGLTELECDHSLRVINPPTSLKITRK